MRRHNRELRNRRHRSSDVLVVVADEHDRETVVMSIREAIANDFVYTWAS